MDSMDYDDFAFKEDCAVVLLAQRFIDKYGTGALDETLRVIQMLKELDRAELSLLWVRVAQAISMLASGSSRPSGSLR